MGWVYYISQQIEVFQTLPQDRLKLFLSFIPFIQIGDDEIETDDDEELDGNDFELKFDKDLNNCKRESGIDKCDVEIE